MEDSRRFVVQNPATLSDVLGGPVGIDNANLRMIAVNDAAPLADLLVDEFTYGTDRQGCVTASCV